MDAKSDGLIKRLVNAFLGRKDKKDGETLSLKSKIVSLEFDLKEKAEENAAIKKEYDKLKNSQKKAIEKVVTKALERVYKELANPLSQLLAMKRFIESGRELATEDIFKVVYQIVADLDSHGVKMVGGISEKARFDSRIHQPSGNEVISEGEDVQIRFVGFIFGETLLKKAMVSSVAKK